MRKPTHLERSAWSVFQRWNTDTQGGEIKMALTVKRVLRLKQRGKYPDGLGLYLQVNGNNRSWIFRYKQHGVQRWMGLGPVTTFSLEEARELARKARQQLKQGNDPLLARQQAEKKLVMKTFKQCASGYLAAHGSKWKTAKGLDDFTASLDRYVYPTCGDVAVALIDTALVMRCIEPIWRSKTPTASRLRGRMEDILHWATVQGFRTGENPARWAKHLEHLLPAVSQLKKNSHHAALPYADMPAFMTRDHSLAPSADPASSAHVHAMSALPPKAAKNGLFDHLVSGDKKALRHGET
jgi:hypothetical protein